jgi:hypothetical protein
VQDGIDTSTAAGRMVFGVIARAEFERELSWSACVRAWPPRAAVGGVDGAPASGWPLREPGRYEPRGARYERLRPTSAWESRP